MKSVAPRLAVLWSIAVLAVPSGAAASPQVTETASIASDPNSLEQARQLAQAPPALPPRGHRLVLDQSGRKQIGKASTYAGHFQGRRMADGHRFREQGSAAASKTLPLGTVAKVTNLETGRTALVTVQDHGPFVDGRTVDVSRATARQLGITHKEGVAPVMVAPVVVPQKDGGMKVGAGAVPGPATAQ